MITSESSTHDKLTALRNLFSTHQVHGFLIPRADQYQGEYVPAFAERLAMITGFNGSAGTAAVLLNKAAILTDGRYTIQVRQEVDGDLFDYVDFPPKNFKQWLLDNLEEGQVLGYDPTLHVQSQIDQLSDLFAKKNITLKPLPLNLVDAIWSDQPAPPRSTATVHPIELAGKSCTDKLSDIRAQLQQDNVDATLISAPESVAWLFNIRGEDVPFTPLPLSHALVSQDRAILFIHPDKLSETTRTYLAKNDITYVPESELPNYLEQLKDHDIKTLQVCNRRGSAYHVQLAKQHGAEVIPAQDPTAIPRAQKNDVEQEGSRQAHIRDGAAISRFLCWLDHQVDTDIDTLDELTVAQKLLEFRAQHPDFKEPSFETISGFGPNGAIVHYRVSPKTNKQFALNNLYLVDSGAQYPDGTTDITRTVAIGTPSDEMRRTFTLVLQGMIDLSMATFPEGTTGHRLDTLARQHLWSAGLDFNHGTGHGVGSYLSVHEGPQSISPVHNDTALLSGMILSNEPGYYKTDAFGIRIENLIMVTPPHTPEHGERDMLSFETLTLAPIDRRLVVSDMLSTAQRQWLNTYHQTVRETLLPLMQSEQETLWLTQATEAI